MSGTWQRVGTYAVPAILLGVFGTQIYQVRVNGLNPWRGAGFAMFSTVDSPDQRLLRAYLLVKGQEFPLTVPRDLARLNAEARILPTPRRLRSLGLALLSSARRSLTESRDGPGGAELAVRVEVWRVKFDRIGDEIRPAKFREITVRD